MWIVEVIFNEIIWQVASLQQLQGKGFFLPANIGFESQRPGMSAS